MKIQNKMNKIDFNKAENIVNSLNNPSDVKRIKNEKGLICQKKYLNQK